MKHAVDALCALTAESRFSLDSPPTGRALLDTVVAAPGFVMPDLSGTCSLKALCSTLVRFHFWHDSLLEGGEDW